MKRGMSGSWSDKFYVVQVSLWRSSFKSLVGFKMRNCWQVTVQLCRLCILIIKKRDRSKKGGYLMMLPGILSRHEDFMKCARNNGALQLLSKLSDVGSGQ